MKKSVKIAIAVAVGVLVIAAIVIAVLFMKGEELPQVDVSEVPLGLEWGMKREEVDQILASHSEYTLVRNDKENAPVYHVTNFQGIEGVSGSVVFQFGESNGLNYVFYSFASVDFDADGKCVPKQLELTQKSLVKQLDAHYEKGHAAYENAGAEQDSILEYWSSDETIFTMQPNAPDKMILSYEPVNSK